MFESQDKIDRYPQLIDQYFVKYYTENNPLIGPHPTRGDVNRYFIGSFLIHAAMNLHPWFDDVKNIWNFRISYVTARGATNNFRAGFELKL